MSLRAIPFPTAFVGPAATFEELRVATQKSLAQLVFASHPLAGLAVLAALALLSPWRAVGAGLGALAGTLFCRWSSQCPEGHWQAGLGGVNGAVLGILWGGVFAQGEFAQGEAAGGTAGALAWLFLPALLGCFALEGPVRRFARSWALPPLALAAVLMGWLSDLVFRAFGQNFWAHPGDVPLGWWGGAGALLLVAAILASVDWRAALRTLLASAAVALAGHGALGWSAIDSLGLWAFTVAPAVFAMSAVFLPGSDLGRRAGWWAAAIGTLVWGAWVFSPLVTVTYPLVIGAYAGIWGVLRFLTHRYGTSLLDPSLQAAALRLKQARREGRPVTVLAGAGLGTASGIPDYVTGNWLPSGIDVNTFHFQRFLVSDDARRLYWEACARFRSVAAAAQPNQGHRALARLQHQGWVETLVTQNVDGLLRAAGGREVVEIHGTIAQLRCLQCSWVSDWPPTLDWRKTTPRCPCCRGLIKPAVIAMGESLPFTGWSRAEQAAKESGLLLVVGTRLAIASAATLVSYARQNEASLILINQGSIAHPMLMDDLWVAQRTEEALACLCALLGKPPAREMFGPGGTPASD